LPLALQAACEEITEGRHAPHTIESSPLLTNQSLWNRLQRNAFRDAVLNGDRLTE
jgi:hypothetical protein